MSQGDVIKLAQDAMFSILILAAPMLGFGLLVGLLVSIFQATTQIQEATLAFVPKIIAVLIAFIVFGPWILTYIVEFTQDLFININKYVQ
ncbi:flagellar biosynthesis protein FliQ [Clostridium sp. D2Q-14]|uniref:flagellar biosynthesis protein FliQ n=1 Tax=Anaeromonas gelatinilytica TaxID=2683194 RepID=UPI00193BB41C|nr:flagellar biosynthesis protein FliQ [Anaeromonas gelatinilytica]MBS4536037.1 flagellar biosynthesis protein FliQ [Anaeromonas gelatinilytica]